MDKANGKEKKFAERVQEKHYCNRCGLTHNAVDQQWQCIDCGAILCSDQIKWIDNLDREVDGQKFYHEVCVFGEKKPYDSWCGPCRNVKGNFEWDGPKTYGDLDTGANRV